MEISKERIKSLENQLEKSANDKETRVEREIDREIKQNEQNEQKDNKDNEEQTNHPSNTEIKEPLESPQYIEPQSSSSSSSSPLSPSLQPSAPSAPSPSTLGPPQPDFPPESEIDEDSIHQIEELNKRISELTSQLEEAKQINLFYIETEFNP